MCFAEHGFFARLGVRSGVPQRRDFARRAAQRRVQWIWYVHNVFTEPTGRKCVPARANRRRTRTRNALLTVHNSSSIFLCPWHRACSASPCLPRPLKRDTCTLSTLLRRLFIGLTSTRAQFMGVKPGFCCQKFWEALRAKLRYPFGIFKLRF